MPSLTLESRCRHLSDPQRNFLWDVTILNFDYADGGSEDLTLRAKNISIPGRSVESIETWFYGIKQKFAGRSAFSNQISIQFEETEDQRMLKSFYSWFQQIHNIDPMDNLGTLSSALSKKNYAKMMYLTMYKYNGEECDKKIEFTNVYPESIGDVSLDYSDNSLIKFDCTLNYDIWKLI